MNEICATTIPRFYETKKPEKSPTADGYSLLRKDFPVTGNITDNSVGIDISGIFQPRVTENLRDHEISGQVCRSTQ